MGGRELVEDISKIFFIYIIGQGKDNGEKKEILKIMGKRRKMKFVFLILVFVLEDDGKI